MAEMDVDALQQQLEALKEQQQKAQQKLNEMKAMKGRGPPGAGDRGFGGPQRASGVFNRLGPGAGPRGGPGQPRDGPPGRTSVFDRLYSSRSEPGDIQRDRLGRNGLSFGRSSRDGPQLHRQSSRTDVDADAAPNSSRQPIHSRLSSRVIAPDGSAAGGSSDPHDLHHREREHEQEQEQDREQDRDRDRGQEAAVATAGRKRLLSAVMVNGEARTVSAADKEDGPPEPPPKRPTLQTDDRSKRRAQLMLGRMLVGTLQKAKDESDAFRSTAARRQELERRAAEKAAAEAERLKEQERAARQQERHNQVCQLLDIEQQAKSKELEIKYAKIIQRRQKLLNFCVTKTQPPIYWLPREPSDVLAALLQEHAAIFEEWKQQQMQQLESEKADLAALIASRKDKSALRLAGGGQQGDDEQDEGQEDGEHQELAEGAAAAAVEVAAAADQDDRKMADGEPRAADHEHAGAQQQADDQYAYQQQQQLQQAYDQAAEQEPPAAAERRSSRRRQRGSDDEEEERLLSSEEEEDL